MNLSMETAAVSLKRILELFSGDDESKQGYIQSIVEALWWMKPHEFDEVCKIVASEMSQGKRPVPSQYRTIYNRLAQEKGWNNKEPAPRCEACSGVGWIQIRMKRKSDGQLFDAMKPCPICSPKRGTPIDERFDELEPKKDMYDVSPEEEVRIRSGWRKLWRFDSTGFTLKEANLLLREMQKKGQLPEAVDALARTGARRTS